MSEAIVGFEPLHELRNALLHRDFRRPAEIAGGVGDVGGGFLDVERLTGPELDLGFAAQRLLEQRDDVDDVLAA